VPDAPTVEQEVVLPVSPDELWEALTDPEQLPAWFGASVEWDLRPGGPAHFVEDDGRERAGVIDVVRPGSELRFRWWPSESPGREATEVRYAIDEVPDGSRLRITERRLSGLRMQASAAGLGTATEGWGVRITGLWLACRSSVRA
jgi:uncharacterized protein YndB with AHSA1/START domain